MFESKVDMRSRKSMTDFLLNHFRYDTMNSWNRSTSYANNMKIRNLDVSREIEDKLYDMLDVDSYELSDAWDNLITDFEYETGYTAGWNGRSGGYLVMYDFEWKPTGHLSYCTKCYQKNFTLATETNCKCGRCGADARVNYIKPPMQKSVWVGRSIDDFDEEDFAEYDLNWLRERVKLVQRFDQLCNDIIEEAVYYAENYEIVDEEYTVVKTHKVLQEA